MSLSSSYKPNHTKDSARTIEKLIAICEAAGTEEGKAAVRLLKAQKNGRAMEALLSETS
jgi:hypothetical protein